MQSRQCYPGEILRSIDVADARWSASRCQRAECLQMSDGTAARSHCSVGRSYDSGGIAQQDEIAGFKRLGDPQRFDQRQPLRVLTGSIAKVALEAGASGGDHRRFHVAGVGAAAAVEKDLYAL
jgi:hypothetical protein